ncbi:hypothetical protein TIFTF001_020293 [Ficus carica]|uniref:Uncharacterized protein n=1 Tax=Ficus carica TaxID=3494 RepID=A0AA88A8C6_FICCA|nr:hypothetical protein TIFTF001_020293 [Ficus carica]
MAINPRVTCSNQNPYPMSFVIAGGSLLLQPDLEQHSIGHSIRHVKVVLAERKLTSYVYAVGKQPSGNL